MLVFKLSQKQVNLVNFWFSENFSLQFRYCSSRSFSSLSVSSSNTFRKGSIAVFDMLLISLWTPSAFLVFNWWANIRRPFGTSEFRFYFWIATRRFLLSSKSKAFTCELYLHIASYFKWAFPYSLRKMEYHNMLFSCLIL